MDGSKLKQVMMCIISLVTLFSFSCLYATDSVVTEQLDEPSAEQVEDALKESATRNPFELTFAEMLLDAGDRTITNFSSFV